jgi:hypothetical protein
MRPLQMFPKNVAGKQEAKNDFEVSTWRYRPKTHSHAPTKNNHFVHLIQK